MKYRHEDGVVIVSLERGDDLRPAIERLAAELAIGGAQVAAIGAVEDPELGCYVLSSRTYIRRTFKGIFEIAALQGNVTIKDGKPFLHAHVVISGEDFVAYGGHLFDAKAGVVVEMFVRPLSAPLQRIQCDEIGLARWEPDK